MPPTSMMLFAYSATSLLLCPFTTISAAIPLQWYEFGDPFTLLFQLGVLYPLFMMTGELKWFLIFSSVLSSLVDISSPSVLSLHWNSSALKALTNIDNKTNDTIEDITNKMGKKAANSDKIGNKSNNPMQDKTGAYGQKRKPGDYLR